MNSYDNVLKIARIGQCGTCKWALRFEHGPSTSEPEDRVCCTSEAHVRYCCEQTGYNTALDFFKENGYVLLLSLEVLVEESYACPHWETKNSESRDQ
jgi:hypothetical protein